MVQVGRVSLNKQLFFLPPAVHMPKGPYIGYPEFKTWGQFRFWTFQKTHRDYVLVQCTLPLCHPLLRHLLCSPLLNDYNITILRGK